MRDPDKYDTVRRADSTFGWNKAGDHPLGDWNDGDVETESMSQFILYAGHEEDKLMAVPVQASLTDEVTYEIFSASLDDHGDLVDSVTGDDVGWTWEEVTYWSHVPPPPLDK